MACRHPCTHTHTLDGVLADVRYEFTHGTRARLTKQDIACGGGGGADGGCVRLRVDGAFCDVGIKYAPPCRCARSVANARDIVHGINVIFHLAPAKTIWQRTVLLCVSVCAR